MSKIVTGESIKVGGSTYILVDTDVKESTPKSISCVEDRCGELTTKSKWPPVFANDNLVDLRGNVVSASDMKKINFVLRGFNGNNKKARAKGDEDYSNKLPKNGSKTFGNDSKVPRMCHSLPPLKNYLFCNFQAQQSITGATIGTATNWTYTVGSLPGISSYTSLFDEYCIRKIEIWFFPKVTEATAVNAIMPLLATAYDPDGSAITSYTDVQQYDTCVITEATQGHYLCYTPSVAVATYGGAFTKYSFEMNQWCDVVNTDILHYGAVSYLTSTAANGDFSYNVEARLWVEFRGVR